MPGGIGRGWGTLLLGGIGMVQFTEPGYLFLLPLLWGWVWWNGRRLLGVSRARRRLILALRMLVILMIVFALAGWQGVVPLRQVCTVFVVDHSASISDSARQQAGDYLKQAIANAPESALSGWVVFGDDAHIDAMPGQHRTLPPIYSRPNPDGTDIASALRLAMAMFPDGYARRIVLLSDGNETRGEALAVAEVARTEGVPIDVIPLNRRAEPSKEVLIESVEVPQQVKVGAPYEVRVVVRAESHAEGTILLDRDGAPVKNLPVKLVPGINVITTTLRTERVGTQRIRAVLQAQPDHDPRNNLGLAVVFVRGEPSVLIAEGAPGISQALRSVLEANRIRTQVVTPNTFPSQLEDLMQYDAVILNDYPASAFSPQQMLVLQSLVRDMGVGLVMVGGERSYQPGGYYGTPIAEMLPVDLDIRHRQVQHASTVLLIVDASGSMNNYIGQHKVAHLAAEASIQTLRMLRENDRFGVIISSHGSDWLLPEMARTRADPFSCEGRQFRGCHGQRAGQPKHAIFPASEREAIIAVLQRIYGTGGGIFVQGSLEMAMAAFALEPPNRSRHIIMLADANDCDEQEGSLALAQRMRAMGITLSVIAFGRGKDTQFLRQLAQVGGGQFYETERADALPRLFTADVSVMTRSAIEVGAFFPKLTSADERLQGIDWSRTPALLAYNLTSERPMAQTLMRTHKDDPLLASWRYGLGTVVAFTSDAQPRWSQRWLSWSGYSVFWANLVRSALRPSAHSNLALSATVRGETAIAELQAFTPSGDPINGLTPKLTVGLPDGSQQTYTMQMVASGRYQAQFPLRRRGLYRLSTEGDFDTGKRVVLNSSLAIPYPTEYRFTRPNLALLTRIAELTGGRVNPPPSQAFEMPPHPRPLRQELWSLALLVSLLLLLTDITVRRVVIGFPEFMSLLWHRLGLVFPRRRATVAAVSSASRLQSAKARAQQHYATPQLQRPSPPAPAEAPASNTPVSPAERRTSVSSPASPNETLSRLLESRKRRQ